MAIYAIGDIQGCYDPLCRLLDKLAFDPSCDSLWALGDLINRGPDSIKVLRLFKSLGNSAKAVLGNHDLHFLGVALGFRQVQTEDTIDQILTADDKEDLINWLRFQPLFHHDYKRNLSMVHAGIPPHWSINETIKQAKILESLLQDDSYQTKLTSLYAKPILNKYNSNLDKSDAIKWTAAYLTRMRLCDAQGNLCFATIDPKNAKPGFLPWFAFPENLQKGKILFGHWASLEGITNIVHIHALDTGCVWGKKLTAIDIDSFKKTSVNSNS